MTATRSRQYLALCLPAGGVTLALFIAPLIYLMWIGATGPESWRAYAHVLTSPRHLQSLGITLLLSITAVLCGILLGTPVGLYLGQRSSRGRQFLEALLTIPASFPGVVIGFMVIQLAGRQGIIGHITHALTGYRLTFAYSWAGLLLGYVYFAIPRVVATVAAGVRTMPNDAAEAGRSLGAKRFRIFCDITLPTLRPALAEAAAIVFATSMSAFGTAYALGADIPVLPLVIYDDFSTGADLPLAVAASLLLAAATYGLLSLSSQRTPLR